MRCVQFGCVHDHVFCISGLCVLEVLWMDGGVALPYPVINWATGHCLFSYYLAWSFHCSLVFYLFATYLTLPRTHSFPRSIICKKEEDFLSEFGNHLLVVPLLFSAALSFSCSLIFSLYGSHPIFLIFTHVIQHWVILSCAFSICPSVGSFLLANLTLLYKSLPHHLSGPQRKLEMCHCFSKINFYLYQKKYPDMPLSGYCDIWSISVSVNIWKSNF